MCDRVEDDYQRLAELYSHSDDVIIARLDNGKNDLKDLVFGDFPTFILFPAGGEHVCRIRGTTWKPRERDTCWREDPRE